MNYQIIPMEYKAATGTLEAQMPGDGKFAIVGFVGLLAWALAFDVSAISASDGSTIFQGDPVRADAIFDCDATGLGGLPLNGGWMIGGGVTVKVALTANGLTGNAPAASADLGEAGLLVVPIDPNNPQQFAHPVIVGHALQFTSDAIYTNKGRKQINASNGGRHNIITRLQTRSTRLTGTKADLTTTPGNCIGLDYEGRFRTPRHGRIATRAIAGTSANPRAGTHPTTGFQMVFPSGGQLTFDVYHAADGDAETKRLDYVLFGVQL